jgi:hypothetical protein
MARRLLATALLLGCARVAGRNAAEGSINAIRDQQQTVEILAKVAGDKAIEGAAAQLATPETAQQIDQAVEAAMARALDDLHRDLMPREGRLARDLVGTAAGISAAAVTAAEKRLEAELPECPGLDRRACLQKEARALGREASSGFVDGLLSPRAIAALAAVAAACALAVLIVRAAWDAILHEPRVRPPRREARA